MNRRSLVLLAISLVLTIVSAAPAACSQGGRTAVRAGVPKPSSEELEGRASTATSAPATRESQVRIWTIHYSAHNGTDRTWLSRVAGALVALEDRQSPRMTPRHG